MENKKQETIERIRVTLKMPPVNCDADAYIGHYDLNNAESIKTYIKKSLRGKIYVNAATGREIILSGHSAGKLASYHSEGELHQKTIVHIPKIIEKMLPLFTTEADKIGEKYESYSYYITPINLISKNGNVEICTVLSIVGYSGKDVYYDQTVFKETPQSLYLSAKTNPTAKTKRVAELLKAVEVSDCVHDLGPTEVPTTATSTNY